MRVIIKFTLRAESSNTAIRGKLTKMMHQITKELGPEAAFFFPLDGKRGGFCSVDCRIRPRSRIWPNALSFG
jgi:hypothetical protein